MAIEILKSQYEDFLKDPQVLSSNPYCKIISDVVLYLIDEQIVPQKCPKKERQAAPEGFITVNHFCDQTILCSASWLYDVLSRYDKSVALKVNNKWYVQPELLLKRLASSPFPIVAKRAKNYMKNHSAK